MRRFIFAAAALLSACVSTEMKGYVGKDVSEVLMAYGQPENVIDLPDGRRAWQFRWGGGGGVIPGRSQTTVQAIGNTAVATTTTTPATIVQSESCLITYIGTRSANSWTITDIRVPKQLVC